MKNKLFLVLATISMLFFLTACGEGDDDEPTGFDPYAGGSKGIEISFQEGAPPDEIYDSGQYPFSVGVVLENKGENDFNPASDFGEVSLLGFNPNYFGDVDILKKIDFELKGKRKNFEGTILDGDTDLITFDNFNYRLDIQGNDKITMRAEVCYDYQTKSSTKICIKENTLEQDDEEICRVNEVKTPKNSGGPVHIQTLSEQPMGQNKVQVLFTVGHVGNPTGQIYMLGTPCEDTVTNVDKDKVLVSVSLPEGTDARITCPRLSGNAEQTTGYVTLYQGSPAAVTCVIENMGGGEVYEPVLSIDLDYRYGDYIDKEIKVLDVSAN